MNSICFVLCIHFPALSMFRSLGIDDGSSQVSSEAIRPRKEWFVLFYLFLWFLVCGIFLAAKPTVTRPALSGANDGTNQWGHPHPSLTAGNHGATPITMRHWWLVKSAWPWSTSINSTTIATVIHQFSHVVNSWFTSVIFHWISLPGPVYYLVIIASCWYRPA